MPRERAVVAIVNDDVDLIRMLEAVFINEGFDTRLFQVGEVSHEIILRDPPDIILLDISIDDPTISWQMVDLLTNVSATSAIPVVVSTLPTEELLAHLLPLAAAGHTVLKKPYEIDELIATVRTKLNIQNS